MFLFCSRIYKISLVSSITFSEIRPWFGNSYLSLIHGNTDTHTLTLTHTHSSIVKIVREDRLRKFNHFLYVKHHGLFHMLISREKSYSNSAFPKYLSTSSPPQRILWHQIFQIKHMRNSPLEH